MSDMHLHHDLGREASGRRHREADALVRSRALQRQARARRARIVPQPSRRMRLVAVASPMVVLAALMGAGAIG